MPRPRPLRNVALGAAGIGYALLQFADALVGLIVEVGLPVRFADDLSNVMEAGVLLLAALGFWKFGEQEVTPLADPRDAEGRSLAPAGELTVAVATEPAQEPVAEVAVRPPDLSAEEADRARGEGP